jgi:ribosomal protein L17
VLHGSIQTTSKRAKALQVFADSFFSKLIRCYDQYEGETIRREVIRRTKDMITVDAA